MRCPRRSRLAAVGFWALLPVHLAALYWPRVDFAGAPADSDKLAHVLLFGLPAGAAALAFAWPWVWLGALALHAPVSEWVQASVLPGRSGDPADMAADLAGCLLGAIAGLAMRRRVRAGPRRARAAVRD